MKFILELRQRQLGSDDSLINQLSLAKLFNGLTSMFGFGTSLEAFFFIHKMIVCANAAIMLSWHPVSYLSLLTTVIHILIRDQF